MRLLGKGRKGAFDWYTMQRFDGHRPAAYIQYSRNNQHFRCVKPSSRYYSAVFDGSSVRLKKSDRNDILNSGDWSTYILVYERVKGYAPTGTVVSPGGEVYREFKRILVGGSDSNDGSYFEGSALKERMKELHDGVSDSIKRERSYPRLASTPSYSM